MQALDEGPRGRGAELTFTLAAPIRYLCCATVSVPMEMRAAAFCSAGCDNRSFWGGEDKESCASVHTMMMPTHVHVIDLKRWFIECYIFMPKNIFDYVHFVRVRHLLAR